MLGKLRVRIALDLYYSTWPVLIGWNPTDFCNWLYSAELSDGTKYGVFGGARWDNPWRDLALDDEPEYQWPPMDEDDEDGSHLSLQTGHAAPVDLPAASALDLVVDLNGRRADTS